MSTENNTQTDTEILLGLVTQLSTHDTDIKSAIQGVNDVTASMKALIAPAITAKGVPTSETDSAQTMADNISKLPVNVGFYGAMCTSLYSLAYIVFDLTIYNYVKIDLVWGSGQPSIKYMELWINDTLSTSNYEYYNKLSGAGSSSYPGIIIDISNYTGTYWFIFKQLSEGCIPAITGISLY